MTEKLTWEQVRAWRISRQPSIGECPGEGCST
jgi:hypothetical protein